MISDGLRQKGRGRKIYESDNRLIVGNRENGGLADVNRNWHSNRNDNIGFRVLAVLCKNSYSLSESASGGDVEGLAFDRLRP